MSAPSQRLYAGPMPAGRRTFIHKARVPVDGFGPAPAASLVGLIGGLAGPILCLGLAAVIGILGLFATMIGAAAIMNNVQQQIRKNAQGSGTMVEFNIVVLMCTLLCSIYVLTKYRRGQ